MPKTLAERAGNWWRGSTSSTPVSLPLGLTQDMLDGYLRDNPNDTPEEGIQEYLLHTSRKTGRSLGEVIQDAYNQVQHPMFSGGQIASNLYRGVAEPVTNVVAEGLGRGFQGMSQSGPTRGFGAFADPAEGSTKSATQHIAKAVVPQTPVGAATLPASLVAGGLPTIAQRMGAMATVGAGAAAATGSSPLRGAVEGAGGQIVGEGVRGIFRGVDAARSILTRRKLLQQGKEDALDFYKGLLVDAPGLATKVSGKYTGLSSKDPIDHLYRMRGPEGLKAMSAAIAPVDDAVIALLGKSVITLPSAKAWAGSGSIGGVDFTPKEALQLLRIATSGKRGAISVPEGIDGRPVRVNAAQMKQEIMNVIDAKSPKLAEEFGAAHSQYARDMSMRNLLRDSGALTSPTTPSGKGPVFNAAKAREYMRRNPDRAGEDVFPNVWQGLSGGVRASGVAPGAQEVLGTARGPRVYLGQGVSETTPLITYMRERVGGNLKKPEGAIPSIASYITANELAGYLEP